METHLLGERVDLYGRVLEVELLSRIREERTFSSLEALKEQILADLPVKSVDILTCRGLTSFYAMEKGLIVGY